MFRVLYSQYLALAPKTVRPDQTYNVFVTLYSMPYKEILVRATLSRNGEEYATGTTLFTQQGTKAVQLLVIQLKISLLCVLPILPIYCCLKFILYFENKSCYWMEVLEVFVLCKILRNNIFEV